MIAWLRGRILSIGEDAVVMDVNGVGYLVHCASRTIERLGRGGDGVELHIETQLRAESLTLYGFMDPMERTWFRLLQTVQGVGARTALALLSVMPPDQLAQAVLAKDKAAFARAAGVGPRLAQRLVSELQNRVGELPGPASGAIGSPPLQLHGQGAIEDAVSALVNLGYGRSEGLAAVTRAASIVGEAATVEVLVRESLQALAAQRPLATS